MDGSAQATHQRPPIESLIDLTAKVAVVTGAGGGIGLGIAQRLHDAGAAVVIADINGDTAAAAANDLNHDGSDRARSVQTDVSDPAAVEAMVDTAVQEFGGINILVNNAGIFERRPVMELDIGFVERMLRVNLVGPLLAIQAASRRMIEQGDGGRIVNITSTNALRSGVAIGQVVYDASKAGLWGLTRSVATELSPHGIIVNALAPGGVTTPGTSALTTPVAQGNAIPIGWRAEPEELGRAVLFLVSDLGSYVLGSHVVVDGGLLVR